ncbi:MAG: DsbA family protein, partial [Bryobacteraceae bacterium]|nr:DsbA family protein [Bryobacteraceae bacterium]
ILRHAFLVFVGIMLPTAQILANEPQTPRASDPKEKCCVLEPMIPSRSHLEGAAAGSVAGHVEGNPQSKIRVVIYEDLQCRDCAVLRKSLDEVLLPRFGKDVAFEFRDFPLPKHSWAREAAIAGRYFQSIDSKVASAFRRHIQGGITSVSAQGFRPALVKFAANHGFDPEMVLKAIADPAFSNAVDADFQQGVAAGIRRTPTVLIGDKTFVENFDIGALQQTLGVLVRGSMNNETSHKGKHK